MAISALERHYRRLLACYPASHRTTYGEEMIGVLLAAAPPSQRRPGIADTLDLFGGAARIRLRRLLTGSADPGWRNALALTSLIAPVLLVALVIKQNLPWMAALTWAGSSPTASAWAFGLAGVAILLAPMVLGLLGLRYVGALAATCSVIWFAIQAAQIEGQQRYPRVAAYLVLIAIEAVALAASPGPRLGLRLITSKGLVIALPLIATAAYAGGLIPTSYPVPQVVARLVIGIVAVAGLPALVMPAGRRLVVLIVAIPGSAFAASLLTFANVQFYDMSVPAASLSLYLPPVALAGLALLAATRSSHQPPPAPSG